jgi:cobalt/nickel transport system permease protein
VHMSDALLSPAVGGALWAATGGMTAYAARKLDRLADSAHVPLMGVMGAFVFAAQMVNFTIPLTGSSGHLGGGLLLAILLGPHAAFIVMASVLMVQALFFADGGLLALGANVFNLAFFTSYVVYPLVWRPLAGRSPGRGRLVAATLVAAVLGLQLGALGVVLETVASGVSSLPFERFVLLMQPIHLAIGVVEGIVTATVVLFVWQVRPELIAPERPRRSLRPLLWGLAAAAVLTGGIVSWFASAQPDGLEWSAARTAGAGLAEPSGGIHGWLARIQRATAILPGYAFRSGAAGEGEAAERWPAPSAGTSTSGLVGGAVVLAVAVILGQGIRLVRRRRGRPGATGTPSEVES